MPRLSDLPPGVSQFDEHINPSNEVNPGNPMMTVRVIDRAASNALWGTPNYRIIIKQVTIDDVCPVCGGPRGEPEVKRFYECGDWHECDVWTNPCGHVDKYADVLKETNHLKDYE